MTVSSDNKFMEDSVKECIEMSGDVVDIWVPKPIDQQPNWNGTMRQFIGDVDYYKTLNIGVERHDIKTDDIDDNVAGTRVKGTSKIHVPSCITVSDDSIVIMDGVQWRVDSIISTVGENIVTVIKPV